MASHAYKISATNLAPFLEWCVGGRSRTTSWVPRGAASVIGGGVGDDVGDGVRGDVGAGEGRSVDQSVDDGDGGGVVGTGIYGSIPNLVLPENQSQTVSGGV